MGNVTNVWCWKPEPGNYWRCYEGVCGLTVDATSKQEAIDHFNQIWNFRAPVEWRYEAPPRPKRADDPKPAAAAVAGDSLATVFHRMLVKEFHSDRGGHRSLSSDEVLTVINRLWDELMRTAK